jgi:hypothetical protein
MPRCGRRRRRDRSQHLDSLIVVLSVVAACNDGTAGQFEEAAVQEGVLTVLQLGEDKALCAAADPGARPVLDPGDQPPVLYVWLNRVSGGSLARRIDLPERDAYGDVFTSATYGEGEFRGDAIDGFVEITEDVIGDHMRGEYSLTFERQSVPFVVEGRFEAPTCLDSDGRFAILFADEAIVPRGTAGTPVALGFGALQRVELPPSASVILESVSLQFDTGSDNPVIDRLNIYFSSIEFWIERAGAIRETMASLTDSIPDSSAAGLRVVDSFTNPRTDLAGQLAVGGNAILTEAGAGTFLSLKISASITFRLEPPP